MMVTYGNRYSTQEREREREVGERDSVFSLPLSLSLGSPYFVLGSNFFYGFQPTLTTCAALPALFPSSSSPLFPSSSSCFDWAAVAPSMAVSCDDLSSLGSHALLLMTPSRPVHLQHAHTPWQLALFARLEPRNAAASPARRSHFLHASKSGNLDLLWNRQ